jgi:hypothetical protein
MFYLVLYMILIGGGGGGGGEGLRPHTTNRQVAGSIPDDIIGIFQ